MEGYNRVTLTGNLTSDPKLSQLADGRPVATFGLAFNRFGAGSQTTRQTENTCFVDVVAWGQTAKIASEHLGRGNRVLIDGALKYEEWDADGMTRTQHKITALSLIFLGQGGSRDYNRVTLIGNLINRPELVDSSPEGRAVAKFRLLVRRSFTDVRTGQPRRDDCYADVEVLDGQAEIASQRLSENSTVFVEGILMHEDLTNEDGRFREYWIRAQRIVAFSLDVFRLDSGDSTLLEEP
ncbi:hypothetical protein C6495_16135 [Candidatus Poribacteria bacterium]|nr:MAG: hypothetical protein C6495_16135 [Candidatus Poribacteria bacterium]